MRDPGHPPRCHVAARSPWRVILNQETLFMFDTITLGPFGAPNASIDAGLLAECLVFYRRVYVVTGAATFKTLVRVCGADELLELCDMGSLEIVFMDNMTAIASMETNVGACLDLKLISSPSMRFSRIARAVADEEGGISGRKANRLFDKLIKTVKRSEYDKEIMKNSQGDLTNAGYLEEAVRSALSYLAPEYHLPVPLIFRPQQVPKFGVRYETNIDFAGANESYHRRVSTKDASLSPAYLLALITSAEPDILIASRSSTEFAVDPLKSMIVSSRVAEIVRKSTANGERLESFQEVVVNEIRSIREAVNSGDRSFREVIRLVEQAHKFKEWIRQTSEDSLVRDEYCKSVAAADWADKLPPKSIRFLVMTGLSALAGLALTPASGIAVGVGLNAADYFLLDRLLKGWKPNQFIEGNLKPFLKHE